MSHFNDFLCISIILEYTLYEPWIKISGVFLTCLFFAGMSLFWGCGDIDVLPGNARSALNVLPCNCPIAMLRVKLSVRRQCVSIFMVVSGCSGIPA